MEPQAEGTSGRKSSGGLPGELLNLDRDTNVTTADTNVTTVAGKCDKTTEPGAIGAVPGTASSGSCGKPTNSGAQERTQASGPNLFHAPESPPTRCEPIKAHRSESKRKSSNLSLMPLFGEEHKRVPSLGPEIVFWTRTKKLRVFPTTRTQAISDQL